MTNQSTLIIGDKSSTTTVVFSNYKHVTEEMAINMFSIPIQRDIIHTLLAEGEKSIKQLAAILPYDQGNIYRFVKKLRDELAIRISRKDGREYFYDVNYAFFKAAKSIVVEVFDNIIENEDK